MDKEYLGRLLKEYLHNFDSVNLPDGNPSEWYKWDAVSCFKENWDSDAEKFESMFEKATGRTGSLLSFSWDNKKPFKNITVGKFYLKGIMFLLNEERGETEFVRQCFKDLYADDGGDLKKRELKLAAFSSSINEKLKQYKKDLNWEWMQDNYSAMCFLNLLQPEDNYFYKDTSCKTWEWLFKCDSGIENGGNFSLERYYAMCDELRSALNDFPDVLQKNKARVDKYAKGFDDDNRILTYDIIHCVNGYELYKKVKV